LDTKTPLFTKYRLNHIEAKKAELVVITHDVDPVELVIFLPALFHKIGVPYVIVKGKARLGTVVLRDPGGTGKERGSEGTGDAGERRQGRFVHVLLVVHCRTSDINFAFAAQTSMTSSTAASGVEGFVATSQRLFSASMPMLRDRTL
jgi:hypothetical protein